MNKPTDHSASLRPSASRAGLASPQAAHLVVYGNPLKPGIEAILRKIVGWAEQGGHRISVEEDIAESAAGNLPAMQVFNGDRPGHTLLDSEQPTLLLSLGGDGTLLHAVHRFWPLRVPVMGVSLGTLSFNAAVMPDDVVPALQAWLRGEAGVSERMVMRVRCLRRGETFNEAIAVNDVVLGKQESLRMIHLTLRQGDELVSTFAGDGLIVSSPTGSTAYNLSAGGPIVFPNIHVLVATAICPHTLAARAVVLNPSPPLELEFMPRYPGGMATLAIDGQIQWTLQADDKVLVEACDLPLQLVTGVQPHYFERLRQKLSWSGDFNSPDPQD